MADLMDISSDIDNLSEADRNAIIKKIDNLGFNSMPGISISSAEVVEASEKKNESLDTMISNVFRQYNEKFGTNFEYETYKKSLAEAININSNEREIRRLIDSQIITNISEILTTKAILVISKVISDQLDRIAKLTETSGLSAEIVSMVGEMFGWVEKLDEIKKKFQKFDSDSKIKSLLQNKESVNNLVRSPEQERLLDALKNILIVRN